MVFMNYIRTLFSSTMSSGSIGSIGSIACLSCHDLNLYQQNYAKKLLVVPFILSSSSKMFVNYPSGPPQRSYPKLQDKLIQIVKPKPWELQKQPNETPWSQASILSSSSSCISAAGVSDTLATWDLGQVAVLPTDMAAKYPTYRSRIFLGNIRTVHWKKTPGATW